jgi:hypothetical protein
MKVKDGRKKRRRVVFVKKMVAECSDSKRRERKESKG